jgi:hypothetical protein
VRRAARRGASSESVSLCYRRLIRTRQSSTYRARWFNPPTGAWLDIGAGTIRASNIGEIALPAFPDGEDWGLSLVAADSAVRTP